MVTLFYFSEVITRETFERNFPKVSHNTEIPLPRKRKYMTDNERETMGKEKIKSKKVKKEIEQCHQS